METQYEIAVAEIKEAKNAVEKDMLLQKYGLTAPKLTPDERKLIESEGQ